MITIDYIENGQLCRIKSDVIDSNWKRIRSFYDQISNQSEVFDAYIEIPWHSFISNLNILAQINDLFDVEISFTSKAELLFDKSITLNQEVSSLDSLKPLTNNQIQQKLKTVGFKRKLTKEQLRNVSKLSRLPFGATFSVPGAGKTTEAITFYCLHRKANEKLLVICPKNAFPAWEEQLLACLPENSLKIKRLVQGTSKITADLKSNQHEVYLISYQQFNICSAVIAKFLQNTPSFVFIDESHRMKGGVKTETGREIQSIAHLPIGKLIMSGTPMPQGVNDLIPQYAFLFPTDGNADSNNVVEKIKKVYVRTTKNELLNPLDFPLLIEKTIVPLAEPQKVLYNLIKSEELRQVSGINNNAKRFYRQLSKSYIRLLQVVSNPSLLLKSGIASFPNELLEALEYGTSNKLKYTALKARKLAKQGKKVLIWSGFVENVEVLTQMLSDLGAKCIHGGVEAGSEEEDHTRERIVRDFHDDKDMFVLVANPAACSEGISLHQACHHAIYLDRNYNAAQFLQSMDRIHRLGLPKGTVTTIEIVHSPETIDELVDSRLIDKVQRMAKVLEDPALNIEPFSTEEDPFEGFDINDAEQLLQHLKGFK